MTAEHPHQIEHTERLLAADWAHTRFGRLHHITAPKVVGEQRHTLCGRFAFEHADAPWGAHHAKPCTICVDRYDQ